MIKITLGKLHKAETLKYSTRSPSPFASCTHPGPPSRFSLVTEGTPASAGHTKLSDTDTALSFWLPHSPRFCLCVHDRPPLPAVTVSSQSRVVRLSFLRGMSTATESTLSTHHSRSLVMLWSRLSPQPCPTMPAWEEPTNLEESVPPPRLWLRAGGRVGEDALPHKPCRVP